MSLFSIWDKAVFLARLSLPFAIVFGSLSAVIKFWIWQRLWHFWQWDATTFNLLWNWKLAHDWVNAATLPFGYVKSIVQFESIAVDSDDILNAFTMVSVLMGQIYFGCKWSLEHVWIRLVLFVCLSDSHFISIKHKRMYHIAYLYA